MNGPAIDRCYRAARRFIPVDLRAHDCTIAVIAAFLAATREPSEAMWEAGDRAYGRSASVSDISSSAILDVWRAMHDALARELGVEP